MKRPVDDTLRQMADDWKLDADALIRYASEDAIEGWTYLGYWPGGSIWKEEGRILYALVRALAPQHILECGTASGCSTTHMLSALKANCSGKLVSVTLEGQGELVPKALRRRWTLNTGLAAQQYLDEQGGAFDFVFEDTDHTVPTTVAILSRLKAMPSVQTVVSHDICHPWTGFAMREAWTEVFGTDYRAYDIEPTDCGLAIWRREGQHA